MKRDDIAIISRPRLVSDVEIADEKSFNCEFLAAPDKYLHNLLPANSYAIQGGVSLFDNPVMSVSTENADRFRGDISNIKVRINWRNRSMLGQHERMKTVPKCQFY